MTKEEARKILDAIDSYYGICGDTVNLDGDYSADELEAFATILREKEHNRKDAPC